MAWRERVKIASNKFSKPSLGSFYVSRLLEYMYSSYLERVKQMILYKTQKYLLGLQYRGTKWSKWKYFFSDTQWPLACKQIYFFFFAIFEERERTPNGSVKIVFFSQFLLFVNPRNKPFGLEAVNKKFFFNLGNSISNLEKSRKLEI